MGVLRLQVLDHLDIFESRMPVADEEEYGYPFGEGGQGGGVSGLLRDVEAGARKDMAYPSPE
jgi:hypothetical protein